MNSMTIVIQGQSTAQVKKKSLYDFRKSPSNYIHNIAMFTIYDIYNYLSRSSKYCSLTCIHFMNP